MDYGTGAIFGCPAHDQRDLEFANAYGLGNTPVVCPPGQDPETFEITDTAYDGDGVLIHSRFLDGMSIAAAKEDVARRLEGRPLGNRPQGKREVQYRLRDWGISRQRYWGCPIPIIHCEACGVVPVPAADLPVELPQDMSFDEPGNPLDRHPTWKHVACPKCGGAALRETDTMDTFVDSSWYFARFTDPWNEAAPTTPAMVEKLSAGRSIYRRHRACDFASALCAVFHPSDAGDGSCRRAEGALRRAVYARHGRARDLSRPGWRPGCIRPKSGSRRMRPAAMPIGSIAARKPRSARSRKCRNRRRTRSIRTILFRPLAPIRRAGSCCRIRRPSATSSGPRKASRARRNSFSACGGWWANLKGLAAPVGTPVPADVSAEAAAIRRAVHGSLIKVEEDIERLRFNRAVAQIHDLANKLSAAIGDDRDRKGRRRISAPRSARRPTCWC